MYAKVLLITHCARPSLIGPLELADMMTHEISDFRYAPTGKKPVRSCVIVCNFVLTIIGGQGSLRYD